MKTIYNLGPGTILLAPSYLHTSIREALLASQNGLLGLKLYTLDGWLLKNTTKQITSKEALLYQYKERIAPIYQTLKIYQEVAYSPVFLNECFNFLDSLNFWNITFDKLPKESDAHQELYTILSQIKDLPLPSHRIQHALAKLSKTSQKNVYILDCFHTLEEEHLIQQLIGMGANLIPMPETLPEKQFYHAVNKRQEVEACAQYIIEHELDAQQIHITLTNASYKPLITQIFQRYQIPYTMLQDTHANIIPHRFSALFSYYIQPDEDTLSAILDCGVFSIPNLQKLKDYLEIFACGIEEPFTHLPNSFNEGHILDPIELEKLRTLQQEAESVRQELIQKLQPLFTSDNIADVIYTIVSYIQESISTDNDDRKMFLQIEGMLKDVYPYLKTKEDISFFLYFLQNMSSKTSIQTRSGAIIADLTQSPFEKEYVFILGATQKDYPAFKPKKGIFDETYHAFISTYPSMEQRYQFYIKQLSRLLTSTKHLCVSYPLGTYEGKGLEAALEIEQFMETRSTAFPLYTYYEPISTLIHLSPAMAEALFIKNGKIQGSISALERYVKCPFSYFLRYGLSLKEPMKIGFPDSYAGTLSHYILETFTEQYGKEYTKVCEEKIEEVLLQEINVMKDVFPSLEKKLENVMQRILTSMTQTLQLLDEFEQHSILRPFCSEHEFHYQITLREDVELALKGYIDRIDASDEFLCILDYKSSSKMLSEANVFAAVQLQLLTYAIVCRKEFKKRVLGSFYVSLKNENIPYIAGKLSRRKPVTHIPSGKEEYEEVRYKAHRLHGWVMDEEINALDDNGGHIVGISQNKEGEVKARKLYDLDSIEKYFTKMYQIIGNRILHGDISLTPMEDACLYCSYHEICRFKGLYAEKKLLVEPGDELYQQKKGSEEDA